MGTAYLVQHAASIMDYVQGLFSFFIAPLFGTVILGMLWKRATKPGGFWGLLVGHRDVDRPVGLGALDPVGAALRGALARCKGHGGKYVSRALVVDRVRHCYCCGEYATRPRPVAELAGLVYGASPMPKEHDDHWYQKPIVWAGRNRGRVS